jgi:hypothetical protein
MFCMPGSDVAPLPRLGEVFFDVRGNSRTMRLSWYADTGVAVFSIWQGGTCTGTFRVPIADLPRLVDALKRGPAGATAPGADVPGAARQVQNASAAMPEGPGGPSLRAGGSVPGPPGDPLAAGAPAAGYPGPAPYADAGQHGSLAGYGAPDRRHVRSDPGAYGGYPDPAARGGYAEPGAYGGYPDPVESSGQATRRPHTEPGGYGGYPNPAVPPGQAGYGGYGGYPDPGQAEPGSGQGYADPKPHSGYPDPGDRGRQPEAAAYGGYPDSGENRAHALNTGSGSHTGCPDAGAYGGYPDPDGYSRQPDQTERGNYPVVGDYSQPAETASPVARGYPQTGEHSQPAETASPAGREYPQTTGYASYPDASYPDASYPDAGEYGGQSSTQARGYREQYGRPAGAAGSHARGSYPAQDSHGGYPDPGRHLDSGLPHSPTNIPAAPQQDHTSLMPAQPDAPPWGAHPPPPPPGTPTAGLPAFTGRTEGASSRGSSGPPYPPDPYLDGELPVSGERSAADRPADDHSPAQRPVEQRSGTSCSRRSEDESARELPYGYPPPVGR